MGGRSSARRIANIAAKSGLHCHWCGRDVVVCDPNTAPDVDCVATIDHVIPLVMGGRDEAANRVLACHCCNNLKGNMHPADWAPLIARGIDAARAEVRAMRTADSARIRHLCEGVVLKKPAPCRSTVLGDKLREALAAQVRPFPLPSQSSGRE